MVLEHEVLPIFEWLAQGIPKLAVVVLFLFATGTLFGFLCSAFRNGPAHGALRTRMLLVNGMKDLLHLSPRRVLAIAILAFREAIRRKVIIVFFLFITVMLFAGWFLNYNTENPAKTYIGFVMWWSNILSLLLVIILSTLSLPTDIQSRTIYTVITKPVYGWEILLGRILGFAGIGTALLIPMWLVSYGFVIRGLAHDHSFSESDIAKLEALHNGASDLPEIRSGMTANHRHDVVVDDKGHLHLGMEKGHRHTITREETDEGVVYSVSQPVGDLMARVVVYGDLYFRDRDGSFSEEGINVGYEWEYRTYIRGKTGHAAIWRFEGITKDRYKEGLPLEMTTRVFRTHKGTIEERITGSIIIRNPETHRESQPIPFIASEIEAAQHTIPVELLERQDDGTSRKINLFDDLVHDDQVEILIRCDKRGQLFGMAQADLYLRPRDNWFSFNFFKGYVNIWIQMVMITSIGVMFSTILNTPVAMLGTMGFFLLGLFTNFIFSLGTDEMPGGGPIESLIRTIKQMNLVSKLDMEPQYVAIIQWIDSIFIAILHAGMRLLPDFGALMTGPYVASGFNIPFNLMLQQLLTMLAYVVAASSVGYFLLKSREIAG